MRGATAERGVIRSRSACALNVGAIVVIVSTTAHAQITLRPAPAGKPNVIAAATIKKAGHPCPKVISAVRQKDGGIAAMCSNHELYLVATVDQVGPIALRCSEAKRLLNISCLK